MTFFLNTISLATTVPIVIQGSALESSWKATLNMKTNIDGIDGHCRRIHSRHQNAILTNHCLLPVEDVFSITGRGTVASGRIDRGVVNVK